MSERKFTPDEARAAVAQIAEEKLEQEVFDGLVATLMRARDHYVQSREGTYTPCVVPDGIEADDVRLPPWLGDMEIYLRALGEKHHLVWHDIHAPTRL